MVVLFGAGKPAISPLSVKPLVSCEPTQFEYELHEHREETSARLDKKQFIRVREAGTPPPRSSPPSRPPDPDESRWRLLIEKEETDAWCRNLRKNMAACLAEMEAFRAEMRNEFRQLRLISNNNLYLLECLCQTQSSLVTTPPIQPKKIQSTMGTLPLTYLPTSQISLTAPQPIHEPQSPIVHSHLWKARCKQVSLKSIAPTGGVKKPRPLRLKTVAACGKYPKSKPQFQCLVSEIAHNFKSNHSFQSSVAPILSNHAISTQSNHNNTVTFALVSGTDTNLSFMNIGCSGIDFVLGDKLAGVGVTCYNEKRKNPGNSVKEHEQGTDFYVKGKEFCAPHLPGEMSKLNGRCSFGRTVVAVTSIRDKGGGVEFVAGFNHEESFEKSIGYVESERSLAHKLCIENFGAVKNKFIYGAGFSSSLSFYESSNKRSFSVEFVGSFASVGDAGSLDVKRANVEMSSCGVVDNENRFSTKEIYEFGEIEPGNTCHAVVKQVPFDQMKSKVNLHQSVGCVYNWRACAVAFGSSQTLKHMRTGSVKEAYYEEMVTDEERDGKESFDYTAESACLKTTICIAASDGSTFILLTEPTLFNSHAFVNVGVSKSKMLDEVSNYNMNNTLGTCSVAAVSNGVCARLKQCREGLNKGGHYLLQLCFLGFDKKVRDKGSGHPLRVDVHFVLEKKFTGNTRLPWDTYTDAWIHVQSRLRIKVIIVMDKSNDIVEIIALLLYFYKHNGNAGEHHGNWMVNHFVDQENDVLALYEYGTDLVNLLFLWTSFLPVPTNSCSPSMISEVWGVASYLYQRRCKDGNLIHVEDSLNSNASFANLLECEYYKMLELSRPHFTIHIDYKGRSWDEPKGSLCIVHKSFEPQLSRIAFLTCRMPLIKHQLAWLHMWLDGLITLILTFTMDNSNLWKFVVATLPVNKVEKEEDFMVVCASSLEKDCCGYMRNAEVKYSCKKFGQFDDQFTAFISSSLDKCNGIGWSATRLQRVTMVWTMILKAFGPHQYNDGDDYVLGKASLLNHPTSYIIGDINFGSKDDA